MTKLIARVLRIDITDANDQPPVFEQAAYRISLRENTPVGSTILITRATDNDTAPNAQISYKFVPNEQGETNYGKFAVNSSTGDVTISTSLDYETEQHLYYMFMQASDGVNMRTARVNIRVLESNDNNPVFVNLPNTTSIAEDADNDTFNVLLREPQHFYVLVNGLLKVGMECSSGKWVYWSPLVWPDRVALYSSAIE